MTTERLISGQDIYRETLDALATKQPEALAIIRRHGFVFETSLDMPDEERTEAERWEKLAFSIYTLLCEVDNIVRLALDEAASISEEREG